MIRKQCKLKLPPVNAVDEATAIKARLERDLDEAEAKAHKSLSLYKFQNFGYWAAIWVHLNRVGQFQRPNPFSDYVELARKKGGET
ncbi:MAG: hypothetical protein R6U93_04765 [Dehalococcoidia bacterium]